MKKLGLSSFGLKLIAMITMVIDHMGVVFFPYDARFRWIGRLSFPIFCFLLVEGFHHTSNVKKYMARLAVFALISEVPFDLFVHADGDYFAGQNIFFTLLLGLMAIYCMQQCLENSSMGYFATMMVNVLVAMVFSSLALLLRTDYSVLGIFYIVIFYLYRGKSVLIFLALEFVTIYFYGGINVQMHMIPQNIAPVAVLFTALYNGKRGPNLKYVFYAFYPVHLLVLVGLYYMMYGSLPGM